MRVLLTALVLTLPAQAQKEPTGTVTGHVILADTHQPARLVQVCLNRILPKAQPEQSFDDQVAGRKPSNDYAACGATGFDGSFKITGLPPGEYYATAKVAGFLSPGEAYEDADPEAAMRDIPRVLIRPNLASNIDLPLVRGGTISGRVQYEDGAPVLQAFVRAVKVDSHGSILARETGQSAISPSDYLTDTDGHFSVQGLRPGKYLVAAYLTTNGGTRVASSRRPTNYERGAGAFLSLPVFAPAAFHQADARVIEIKGSERVTDAQVEVRFSALHTVRGSFASSNQHVPNEGYIELKDDTDKGFGRLAELQDDGSFELNQVPAGTYTLSLSGATEATYPANPTGYKPPVVLRTYADARTPVLVLDHDLTLPAILLEEKSPTPKP